MKSSVQYLVYYRVSTKGQGESGLGLEAQRAYVQHFLPADSVAGEVTEVQSAKNIEDRPVLQAAISRCKREGLTLAVAKVDRLSRNTGDAISIYDELRGRMFACDIPGTPGEKLDRFTFTIFMAIADRERELISIRTKQALQAKKERDGSVHPVKGHVSNFTEAGREKALAKKAAGSKREDRKVRLAVRALRDRGETLSQIADQLNKEGFTTMTGKAFLPMTVKRILDREGGEQ